MKTRHSRKPVFQWSPSLSDWDRDCRLFHVTATAPTFTFVTKAFRFLFFAPIMALNWRDRWNRSTDRNDRFAPRPPFICWKQVPFLFFVFFWPFFWGLSSMKKSREDDDFRIPVPPITFVTGEATDKHQLLIESRQFWRKKLRKRSPQFFFSHEYTVHTEVVPSLVP